MHYPLVALLNSGILQQEKRKEYLKIYIVMQSHFPLMGNMYCQGVKIILLNSGKKKQEKRWGLLKGIHVILAQSPFPLMENMYCLEVVIRPSNSGV